MSQLKCNTYCRKNQETEKKEQCLQSKKKTTRRKTVRFSSGGVFVFDSGRATLPLQILLLITAEAFGGAAGGFHFVQIVEGFSGAFGDAGDGIFRDIGADADLLGG